MKMGWIAVIIILNAIIDEAEARYEESFGSAENTGRIPENKEEFLQITMGSIMGSNNERHNTLYPWKRRQCCRE